MSATTGLNKQGQPQAIRRRGLVRVAGATGGHHLSVGNVVWKATCGGLARRRPRRMWLHGEKTRGNIRTRCSPTKAGRPGRGHVETRNLSRKNQVGAGLTSPLRTNRRRKTEEQGNWAANSPCWSDNKRYASRKFRIGWSCTAAFVGGLTRRWRGIRFWSGRSPVQRPTCVESGFSSIRSLG